MPDYVVVGRRHFSTRECWRSANIKTDNGIKQQTLDISLQKPLTQSNREALYHFSRTEDREPPLVFVGREAPIEDIEYALRRTREAGRTLSNIRIVQGPPGSGKTSLLHQVAGRYETQGAVVPVRLSGEVLTSPIAVASSFIRACGFEPQVLSRSHTKAAQGGFGIRWLGATLTSSVNDLDPMTRLSQGAPLWDVLDNFLQVPSGCMFLVLVDEAQRISPDDRNDKNVIATQLHDGNTGELIITTVFGGLSDTASQLAAVGISRPPESCIHHLSSLTSDETQEAIEGFLDHDDFGLVLSPNDRQLLVRVIVQVSEGYPRHLHSYFRGLARTLSDQTKSFDLEQVLAHGHEMRINFCEMRLNMADLGAYERALIDFAKENPEAHAIDSERILERAMQRGQTRTEAMKSHQNAIHCGVIDRAPSTARDKEQVCFPIPSFRTYMGTGGDREKTRALMTESHGRYF